MRLARGAVVLSVAAVGLTALLVAPAAASPTVVTVISQVGLPSGFSETSYNCNSDATLPGGYEHVAGPATVPLGEGSLALEALRSSDSTVNDTLKRVTASSVSALSLADYTATTGNTTYEFGVDLTFTNGSKTDLLDEDNAPTSDSWASLDMMTTSLTWDEITSASSTTEPDTTLADYIAGHGDALLTEISLVAGNCDGISTPSIGPVTTDVDDLVLGIGGRTTTYDFESPAPLTLGLTLPKTEVTGHPAHLTGSVTDGTAGVAGLPVQLWAKPSGKTVYSKLATATSSPTGALSLVEHPAVTTSYEWRLVDPNLTPAQSAASTLTVHSRLTLVVGLKSRHKGESLTASGKLTPKTKGATITVWSVAKGKKHRLGKAKTASSGAWRLTKMLARGKQSIYASVAATRTNAAATSASVPVRVT